MVGGEGKAKLSRGQLLANCASVIRSTPEVVDKMKRTLKAVRPELLPQLDALLAQPRCVQMALDLTRSVDRVITTDNIEEAFEKIRGSVAEEVTKAAEAEKKILRNRHREEKKKLKAETEETRARLEKVQGDLGEAARRDQRTLENWIRIANDKHKSRIKYEKLGITIVLIGASIVLLLGKFVSVLLAGIVAGFGLAINIPGVWGRLPPYTSRWSERRRKKELMALAAQASREDILAEFDVNWEKVSAIRRGNTGGETRTSLF